MQYKGQSENLPIVVVAGKGPNLFGRNWLQKLKLDWSQIHLMGQGDTLQDVLNKHGDVFKEGLGKLRGTKAKINVDDDMKPKFFKPRPVPFSLREKVDRELQRLQDEGIIEPTQFSEWATPIVPIVKEDGSIRICGDYRLTANQASKLDSYPLPRVDELFSRLSKGKLFSKLDLRNAYLQLVLDEESRPLTTINTHKGLFVYNRLPFGISSAPGVFQRTMDCLLQGIPNVVAYIDDVLLTGESGASFQAGYWET